MNILVQQSQNKFTSNLDSLSHKYRIIFVNIDRNIYKIRSQINPDVYIFSEKQMGHEERHFCQNIKDKKIIVYTESKDAVEWPEHVTTINHSNMPLLCNTQRFKKNNATIREIDYCYFLDYDEKMPPQLINRLYPNTKDQILLFNNVNIKHPQNLGYLTEDEKAQVLNNTSCFISNNMNYAVEANMCGCQVVNLDWQDVSFDDINYKTYPEYIETIL